MDLITSLFISGFMLLVILLVLTIFLITGPKTSKVEVPRKQVQDDLKKIKSQVEEGM